MRPGTIHAQTRDLSSTDRPETGVSLDVSMHVTSDYDSFPFSSLLFPRHTEQEP